MSVVPAVATASAVPGLAWPAIPGRRSASILAVLQQLEDSQWWPPELLLRHQLQQASALLVHAFETVPYYRELLPAAGVDPRTPLTAEAWSRLPVLRRADVQEAGTRLYSTRLPEQHGKTYELSTTGSTGRPVRVRGTGLFQVFWDAFTLREHLWHGRDFSGSLAIIRSYAGGVADYPDGRTVRSWGRSTAAIYNTGPAHELNVRASAEQQLDWLQRRRPNYLLTYPSALRALARLCLDRGERLPGLRELRTLSEVVPAELRDLCRKAFGLEVVDIYSAQETGYLALQCPEQSHYHLQAESALVEVLNDQDGPCAAGEVGRVVVTPLHNFAMPLLRYDLGDYAEVGPPCSCGRGLPVVTRILGRERNLLTYPDGHRAWPLIGDRFYGEIAPIRQFQMVQKRPDLLELRIVVPRLLTAREEAQLRAVIHDRTGHAFTVDFSYHEEIPRGPGGKYEDFRSEL